MAKNIVLFADGTGNRGGYTPDSNVYKLYNAIDIHGSTSEQITFYDNGVGTSQNKYWRAISGAFGFGFRANVCDLYQFLARNYKPGDNVYIFGFSRGAATVRAFSGFIAACGLVDGRDLDRRTLQERTDKAFDEYRSAGNQQSVAEENREKGNHGAVPIKVIGVWDTVSALGWPQNWRIMGAGMWVINGFFSILDAVFDAIPPFAHRFYNYELTDNVEFAYQALAIDDERKTFKPMVWNEKHLRERATGEYSKEEGTAVEQVWFAGAHSNVGGGYGRTGLANVALAWMMRRAQTHGLKFKPEALEEIRSEANVHGRLFNSRDGLAVYFRYQPREIEDVLCKDKLRGRPRIHRSVLERIESRTANYAPGHLPREFEVVDSDPAIPAKSVTSTVKTEAWEAARRQVKKWAFLRKLLYAIFLEFTLLVVVSAWWFWIAPPEVTRTPEQAGFMGHVAEVLNYFTPVFFEGLVTVAVLNQPLIFAAAVGFILVLWGLAVVLRARSTVACETVSKVVMASYRATGNEGGSAPEGP